MTDNPSVSIVIPVYNSEKYLRMMVDSVLKQTFQDFELLLVDDGSTDSSGSIVDEYALKDARVKALHKKNGGVSDARNAGIEAAKGEYLVFWDNDDYVYPDYLEVMVNASEGYDLLITRPVQCRIDGPFVAPIRNRTGKCIASGHLNEMSEVFPVIDQSEVAWVWAQMFRRDIMVSQNLRFEKINSEDTMFSYNYIKHISSVKMIDFAGYCYIHRNGSLSDSHKYVAEDDWIEKRYYIYLDIWKRFSIDIDKRTCYRDAVFNRFAIRVAAFLLKGYHQDTFVKRKERMRRWRWANSTKVLRKVNGGGKTGLFIKLSKHKLYVFADLLLYLMVTLRERLRNRCGNV